MKLKTATHALLMTMLLAVTVVASQSVAAGIRTGEDYLEECSGLDDTDKKQCREPIFGEVVALQANQSRQANPFSACPVDIVKPEAFGKLLEELQKEFIKWLKANKSMQDEPLQGLVKIALQEMDVCSLDL